MTLGPGRESELEALIARAVPAGAKWHLHMSPPCQALSKLQHCSKPENRRSFSGGMSLVHWCLNLVLRLRPDSWSFEEVECRELVAVFEFLRVAHPDYVDFAVIDFSKYGLCQTRSRVLAGLPATVERFTTDPLLQCPVPRLCDTLDLPEGAVYHRASVGKNPDPEQTTKNADGTFSNTSMGARFVRPVTSVAWTCTASTSAHAYLTEDYRTIRSFTPREELRIQSFPESYRLPSKGFTNIQTRRGAGNAYPPMIARKFMQCVSV